MVLAKSCVSPLLSRSSMCMLRTVTEFGPLAVARASGGEVTGPTGADAPYAELPGPPSAAAGGGPPTPPPPPTGNGPGTPTAAAGRPGNDRAPPPSPPENAHR